MSSPSVLVASEHSTVRDAVLSALETRQLHGVTADLGQSLERLRVESYPVVIIEDRVNGIDGVDLFEHLKQVRHGLAGLLVCEQGDLPLLQRAFDAGIRRVLSLPLDADELTDAVESLAGAAGQRSTFAHLNPDAPIDFVDERGMQKKSQVQECMFCGQLTPWLDNTSGYYFCSPDCQTLYLEATKEI